MPDAEGWSEARVRTRDRRQVPEPTDVVQGAGGCGQRREAALGADQVSGWWP